MCAIGAGGEFRPRRGQNTKFPDWRGGERRCIFLRCTQTKKEEKREDED